MTPRIEQSFWGGGVVVRDDDTGQVLAEVESAAAAGAFVAGLELGAEEVSPEAPAGAPGFFDELFGA